MQGFAAVGFIEADDLILALGGERFAVRAEKQQGDAGLIFDGADFLAGVGFAEDDAGAAAVSDNFAVGGEGDGIDAVVNLGFADFLAGLGIGEPEIEGGFLLAEFDFVWR